MTAWVSGWSAGELPLHTSQQAPGELPTPPHPFGKFLFRSTQFAFCRVHDSKPSGFATGRIRVQVPLRILDAAVPLSPTSHSA